MKADSCFAAASSKSAAAGNSCLLLRHLFTYSTGFSFNAQQEGSCAREGIQPPLIQPAICLLLTDTDDGGEDSFSPADAAFCSVFTLPCSPRTPPAAPLLRLPVSRGRRLLLRFYGSPCFPRTSENARSPGDRRVNSALSPRSPPGAVPGYTPPRPPASCPSPGPSPYETVPGQPDNTAPLWK